MESPNSSKIIKKFNQQLVFSHEEISTQIVLQVSPTKFSRINLHKLFQRTENLFYETTLALIPNPAKFQYGKENYRSFLLIKISTDRIH